MAANSQEDEFHQRVEVALDAVVLRSPAALFWSAVLLAVLGTAVVVITIQRKIVTQIAERSAAAKLVDRAGRTLPKPGDHKVLRGAGVPVFLASDTYALSIVSDAGKFPDGTVMRMAARGRVEELTAGTKVIVLEAKPGFARVRVINGSAGGRIGWVLPETLE